MFTGCLSVGGFHTLQGIRASETFPVWYQGTGGFPWLVSARRGLPSLCRVPDLLSGSVPCPVSRAAVIVPVAASPANYLPVTAAGGGLLVSSAVRLSHHLPACHHWRRCSVSAPDRRPSSAAHTPGSWGRGAGCSSVDIRHGSGLRFSLPDPDPELIQTQGPGRQADGSVVACEG